MTIAGVDIKLVKSNRKTVSIYVERDGSVSALVPDKLEDKAIEEIIESKKYLIHKNLAEWSLLNESKVNREYVNGQSFMYLGRNYRLKLTEDENDNLSFSKGRFYLPENKKHQAKEEFKSFYKAKLQEKLPAILKRYSAKIGVQPKKIKVMELQNRWGSCSPSGNINFHWKCAMAPIDVINYIVAHELVHLIHPNHTSEFWNELDKLMPNYHQHHEWLKVYGAGMDL
jgi:predicted metal-dependent hydrolase